MKKILVVTYGGGHVNLLVPVIKALQQRGDVSLAVLGLSIAGQVLARAAIPYSTYLAYLTPDEYRAVADAYGKQLAERWHVDGKGISYEDSVAYLGINMRDLVALVGEETAWQEINTRGRQAFLPLQMMEHVVRTEVPDLILTGISPRSERAVTMVGKQLGIPTINMHDYLATEKRHFLEADRIGVMSSITRDNLVRLGHSPEKIVVTGQPAFDTIAKHTFDRNEVLSELGIAELPARHVIVYGTQALPGDIEQRHLEAVLDTVAELGSSFYLIIKPHPGQNRLGYYQEQIYHKNISGLATEVDIRKLISVCDLLITFYSTIALETILMGKPLVQLNLGDMENPVPLHAYGVACSVTERLQLRPAIEKIIENINGINDMMQTKARHYFSEVLGGQGTKNTVHMIADMLGLVP